MIGMSVWSIHDRHAGRQAMKLVKRHGGMVKLGLRPVNYPNENATWVPEFQPTDQTEILVADHDGRREVTIRQKADASPVWVAISEGKVVGVRYGRLADDDIEAILSQLLS